MTEKLIPCPWCGGTTFVTYDRHEREWVVCLTCYASGPLTDKGKSDVAWNKRAEVVHRMLWDMNLLPVDYDEKLANLEAENKRLKEDLSKSYFLSPETGVILSLEVNKLLSENDRLRTTIRKARKLLRVKPAGFDGDGYKYIIEARKVLKEGLKGDDVDQP